MKYRNYTVLYLENMSRYSKLILEDVLQEDSLKQLFYQNPMDLRELLNVSSVDQLKFIFSKIIADLPDIELSKQLQTIRDNIKDKDANNSKTDIVNAFQKFNVFINLGDFAVLDKLYLALKTPFDFNAPPPAPLQNFGKPYTTSSTQIPNTSIATTSASGSLVSTTTTTPGASGVVSAPAGAGAASLPPNRETEARGQQINQRSTYRQSSRTPEAATRGISPKGGPTYYVRVGFNQFRPAVQADMDAGIELFMKNPNPIYAAFNPYVKVEGMAQKALRASPATRADRERDFDRQMLAQGNQRLGPGGVRYEKGRPPQRKSQFGGALGSASNFLGDLGNTLTGRGTSRR